MTFQFLTNGDLVDADFSQWAVTSGGKVRDAQGREFTAEDFTTALQELEARVAEIKAFHARVLRMVEAAKPPVG